MLCANVTGSQPAICMHVQCLAEYQGDSDKVSKIYANLSWVCVELYEFEQAIEHALLSVGLVPSWGKAHARHGAAMEAAGRLLDASKAYQAAQSHGFTDRKLSHALNTLQKKPRFRKLSLIQRARSKEVILKNKSRRTHCSTA